MRRRRPVWVALSDLWLDTELTDLTLKHVARVLAASGYGDQELMGIHRDEVMPVVSSNLRLVAGVWDGFDEDWLCERAARQAGRKRARFSLERWRAERQIRPDWARLLALLPAARAEQAAGDVGTFPKG